jgi:GDP-4-dehydro-6-deoxy-D-mannose reductase
MTDLLEFSKVYDAGRFDSFIKSGLMHDIYHAAKGSRPGETLSQSDWQDKRILITGSDGMVGSTMADILIALGAKVHGTIKRHAINSHPNIQHNLDSGKLIVHEVDLCDYGRTSELVKDIEPHCIFHQAAESFVPTSIQQPSSVVENNCVSTTNVLEAATKFDKSLEGVQLACSSEEYGFVKDESELPIAETRELRPTSTYAVTKVFTEYIGKAYYHMYRTPTFMTRSFNQEGPRRGQQFFTARVAKQMADLLHGHIHFVTMGNPNSVRDFTHIHDSATAQLMSVLKCDLGESYNICSGKGISTGDYVRLALRIYDLADTPIFVDQRLLRNYERGCGLFDGFIGSNEKFCKATGWKPTKSLVDIIQDGVRQYA